MPLVIFRSEHDSSNRVGWFRDDLIAALPGIIAPALGVRDKDIIVSTAKHYPPHDRTLNGKEFEIYIVLHAFPDRMENLPDRVEKIRQGVRTFLDNHHQENGKGAKGFVWVLPVDTVFAKI